jgi:hypothetical protein
LIDGSNLPVSNKLVIAYLVSANGEILPYGYLRKSPGKDNKYLVKPITGNYSKTFMDPFAGEDYFKPIYTDKNGEVQFLDLGFSVRGPIGQYEIGFYCDGVASQTTFKVDVQTSVARLRMINNFPDRIVLGDVQDNLNHLSAIVQAVDENGYRHHFKY